MKLLVLCHRLPYPPHKGEKIRALNILKHLSERHELYLGTLVDDDDDLGQIANLRAYARGIVHQRIYPTLRKALAASALVRARPISVDCFYSRILQRKIDDLIEREQIEAVLCSSSPMAEYLFRSRHRQRLAHMLKVMDLIDVDSYKWLQYAEGSSILSSWIYRHEARHLGAYEQRIAAAFDRVLVVSERERNCFPGGSPPANLVALGNGVDLEYFSPRHAQLRTQPGPNLVFTGVMDYRPNIDGVRWFVDSILPVVRRAVPDVRLYIVGNRPTADVRRLAKHAGVVVTGYVEDVRDYIAGASVCLAPLRIARGVQNKILEAMASGRPVIATRAAFEGIDAVPGRDLLVADDAAEFAAATVHLLADSKRCADIGRSARECVERRYSWGVNLRALDELFPAGEARSPMSVS